MYSASVTRCLDHFDVPIIAVGTLRRIGWNFPECACRVGPLEDESPIFFWSIGTMHVHAVTSQQNPWGFMGFLIWLLFPSGKSNVDKDCPQERRWCGSHKQIVDWRESQMPSHRFQRDESLAFSVFRYHLSMRALRQAPSVHILTSEDLIVDNKTTDEFLRPVRSKQNAQASF